MKNIPNLYTEKLENGLQVVYYFEPNKHTFYLEAVVNGGSAHENIENAGISHFLEHVTSSSIKSYPKPRQLAKASNKMGASYNASTSYDNINYYIYFPIVEIKKGLNRLYEHLFEATFDEKIIETQRKVILDEYLNAIESKGYTFTKFLYKTRFVEKDWSQKTFPIGKKKVIKNTTKQQLMDWHKRWFDPSNIILGGTGSIEPKKFLELVRKQFGGIKNKNTDVNYILPFEKSSGPTLTSQTVVAKYDKEFEKAYLAVSFPSINTIDAPIEDFIYFRIFKDYLANSGSSRLFQELREKNGLVYDVGAVSDTSTNYASWGVSTSFDIEVLGPVISILKKELKRVYEGKFNENDIKSIREYISKTYMMRYDYPNNLLNWYMIEFFDLYITKGKNELQTPEDIFEIYKNLTTDKIRSIIPKLFDFSKINIVLYGKFDEKDKLKIEKKLSSLIFA